MSVEQRVVDFEKLAEHKDALAGFDVGFCCLGTTRREAGSAEAFRRVDYDYVHEVASSCKEGGTKHFHLVSSAGADKNSMMLYPQTKGLIEQACSQLMFDRLSIYRPKILGRENQRFGEKVFLFLCKPITAFSPQTLLTPCSLLARAMVNNCDTQPKTSNEILFNQQIYELGGEGKAKSTATN